MARYRIRLRVLRALIREAWGKDVMMEPSELYSDVGFDDRTQVFNDRYGKQLQKQPDSFDRRALIRWFTDMGVRSVDHQGRTKSARQFLNIMFPSGSRDLVPIVSGSPQSYVKR